MRKSIALCLLLGTLISMPVFITRAADLPPTDGKAVVDFITKTTPYTDLPL